MKFQVNDILEFASFRKNSGKMPNGATNLALVSPVFVLISLALFYYSQTKKEKEEN